jgi:hypothetical protein
MPDEDTPARQPAPISAPEEPPTPAPAPRKKRRIRTETQTGSLKAVYEAQRDETEPASASLGD